MTWLQGGDDTLYRRATLVRHGRADEPDLAALTMGAVGHYLRKTLAEDPPPRHPRLEIVVQVTVTARKDPKTPKEGDDVADDFVHPEGRP